MSINGSQRFRITNITLLAHEWCIFSFQQILKDILFSLDVRVKFVLHFVKEEYETP